MSFNNEIEVFINDFVKDLNEGEPHQSLQVLDFRYPQDM